MSWLYDKVSEYVGGTEESSEAQQQQPEKDAQDTYGNAAVQDAMKAAQGGDTSWWDKMWGNDEQSQSGGGGGGLWDKIWGGGDEEKAAAPGAPAEAPQAEATDPVQKQRFEQDVAILEGQRQKVDEYNKEYEARLEKWRAEVADYNKSERDDNSPTGWKQKKDPGPRPSYSPPVTPEYQKSDGSLLSPDELRKQAAKKYPSVKP